MALAEDADLLAAVRAAEVGIVLHEAQHGNVHHVRHFHGFRNDHGHQILRGSDDDDTIHRQALEHRQGYVAGSGGHVNEQIVNVLPDNVRPELLHRARDDWAAPYHRVGGVVQQQIDGHYLNARAGQRRVQAVFVRALTLRDAEGGGCGGAGDVGIQNADPLSLPCHGDSQHGRDRGFAHAALAGDHGNDLLHAGVGVQLRQQALGLAIGAIRAAFGTISVTRTHNSVAPFFLIVSIIGRVSNRVNRQSFILHVCTCSHCSIRSMSAASASSFSPSRRVSS